MAKLNRGDTFTLFGVMQELKEKKEELQKLKNCQIIEHLRAKLGYSVSGVTLAKFMKQLDYVKPVTPPKIKSDKMLARMGRVEVVLAELLFELERQGMKSAQRLLEKLGKNPDKDA